MALESGTKLGPYDIQSLIGSGGMGEVYRAYDGRLGRIIAIKVLPKSYSKDAERMRRFVQEARAAAGLNHPNILSIFDIGEAGGSPYIVSELLEGQTLRERMRSGVIPQRKAVDYALQVARGLTAAHARGIVHRDLKPENLYLTNDERVKILDFGLAKLTRPEEEAGADEATIQVNTEPGQVMGTVGYMSPEQVRGKAADHRSDIFSFGAILYEMLAGQRAFQGESAADTMSAILKEEPAELTEITRNVNPALERVVRHCLEKTPAQRYQSAGDLAFNLESLTDSVGAGKSGAQSGVAQAGAARTAAAISEVGISQTGIAQSGTSYGQTGISPSGISRLGASSIASASSGAVAQDELSAKAPASDGGWKKAVFAIVLAAAMMGVGWWLGRGSVHLSTVEYQPITFGTGAVGNARFTPDGSIVYSASWDGGPTQLYISRTGEHGARELGLKDSELLAVSKSGELAVRLNSAVLNGWADVGTLARVPMGGGAAREVLDHVEDADWAADGENMAVIRYIPEALHWRLEYPIGRVLIEGPNWISDPKISPDGKWIAFADHQNASGDDEGAVAVIGTGPNEKERILSAGWSSLEGVMWSPRGDEVWFSSTQSGGGDSPKAVSLSGKLRVLTNVPGGMWLQDVRSGTALAVMHRRRIGIRGMAPEGKEERELGWYDWSVLSDITPDGKKIVFEEAGDGGGPNYTTFVRDTDGSPPVKIGEGVGLAISADGKWLIMQPAKGGQLSVVPTGAGQVRLLTYDKVSYERVRWLPGNKEVLASGYEAGHGSRDYLIDVSTGNSRAITPEGTVGTLPSPDGRSTAARQADGRWAIVPLDGGSVRLIPGLDTKYRVFGWSADGASVFAIPELLQSEKVGKVYRVDVVTGKMVLDKTFGEGLESGIGNVGAYYLPAANGAYAYVYMKVLSQIYVVRGMK
jgi:eukaryotic-like serine/threonine-protein kinase